MDNDMRADLEGFELSLIQMFAKRLVFDHIDKNTPMSRVRELASEAGVKFGRTLAVLRHEGSICPDTLMAVRALENEWKGRFIDSIERQLRPGGQIREFWNAER